MILQAAKLDPVSRSPAAGPASKAAEMSIMDFANIRFDALSHRSRMPHALRRALRPFLAALPQTLLL